MKTKIVFANEPAAFEKSLNTALGRIDAENIIDVKLVVEGSNLVGLILYRNAR